MSSVDVCTRLTNAIHGFQIGKPIWPQLRLVTDIQTIHGRVSAGTPVTFVSVTGGAWNVECFGHGTSFSDRQLFLVLPDEVEVMPDDI